MRLPILFLISILVASAARGQIQVDLKFKRVQYVAYEPIIATVQITNLAGRDIELRDGNGQRWFGFEVTAREGRFLAPLDAPSEPPLRLETGQSVARKINLTPRFPVHDLGPYHVRANVFFADLNKFYLFAKKSLPGRRCAADLAADGWCARRRWLPRARCAPTRCFPIAFPITPSFMCAWKTRAVARFTARSR